MVMLSNDLGIGSHLRGILENLIVGAGGNLTTSVRKSDIYACKYREGEDYRLASRSGKDVGNLAWLYYLITTNVWTSPLRRLLHYPVARQGIPGFKNLRISLSNYTGEARVYLENLVSAAGAECTKTLKQDNTHLITAHVQSEKCSAAKDWGIHLINHLWLEESYAKWRMQSVTDTRYTHFPRRTNLGEVVGQTKLDRDALERNFFSEDVVERIDAPNLPRTMQAKIWEPLAAKVQTSSAVTSPAFAVNSKHVGNVPSKQSKDGHAIGEQENYCTPVASRFIGLGKENETPTTGSRKSKDVAMARLHDLTPDIALYEKEKKRVGGVVFGGRRKNDEDRIVSGQKRSIDEASGTEAVDDVEAKKARKSMPLPSMHLLVSGYKKWGGHPKAEEYDKVGSHHQCSRYQLTTPETTPQSRNYCHNGPKSCSVSGSTEYPPYTEVRSCHFIRSCHHLDRFHRLLSRTKRVTRSDSICPSR
jgi:twin BRCT domain